MMLWPLVTTNCSCPGLKIPSLISWKWLRDVWTTPDELISIWYMQIYFVIGNEGSCNQRNVSLHYYLTYHLHSDSIITHVILYEIVYTNLLFHISYYFWVIEKEIMLTIINSSISQCVNTPLVRGGMIIGYFLIWSRPLGVWWPKPIQDYWYQI